MLWGAAESFEILEDSLGSHQFSLRDSLREDSWRFLEIP